MTARMVLGRTCWWPLAVAGLALAGCQSVAHRPHKEQPPTFGRGDQHLKPAQEADLHISFGREAEQRGDLDQAATAYRAAIAKDPRRADAYCRLAVVCDKRGDFVESEIHYRKALASSPGKPEVFCDYGYSLYVQRRWQEAEMNLRQSLALNPEFHRAHNNLGLVLAHQGRETDALTEFRKAGLDAADAHCNLAFVLSTEQRWDEARGQYGQALAANPNCEIARQRLAELGTIVAKLHGTPPSPSASPLAVALQHPNEPFDIDAMPTLPLSAPAPVAVRPQAVVLAAPTILPRSEESGKIAARTERPGDMPTRLSPGTKGSWSDVSVVRASSVNGTAMSESRTPKSRSRYQEGYKVPPGYEDDAAASASERPPTSRNSPVPK